MTDPAFDKADQTISQPRNADRDDDTIDFGFRTIQRADKARMVRGVFDSVADRYDIMNDVMSGGIHRLWKAAMIDWMAPQPHQKLIDLAGGTGDIVCGFCAAAAARPVSLISITPCLRRGVGGVICSVWRIGLAGVLPMPNHFHLMIIALIL